MSWRFGVREKFLTLVGVVLVAVFTTIAVYLAQSNTTTLRNKLLEEAKAFSVLATRPIGSVFVLYKDSGTLNIDREVADLAALNHNVSNIAIFDVGGKQLFSQDKKTKLVMNEEEYTTFEPIYRYNHDGSLSAIVYPYLENSGAHRFTFLYSISNDSITQAVAEATRSVILLSIISLVGTLLLIYIFVNLGLIRRIRQISTQSSIISHGNLDQQINVRSNDELGDLASSVNSMADSLKGDIIKLQENDRLKSEFMMITSHNLRTPLTIINGYLDQAEDLKTVDELRQALRVIGAGSKRLSTFAEDVLTISQIEAGSEIVQQVPTQIQPFITIIAGEFKNIAALNGIELKTDIQAQNTSVVMSQPHVRAAVWNLLDNSVKFTPKGGVITLALLQTGSRVEIRISDTGIGISSEELPKLFTKFHRGTSTLTYNYEGTGIGLYASKIIVERHGGTVRAESELGKGSSFIVSLPVAEPSAAPATTEMPAGVVPVSAGQFVKKK